MGSTESYGVRGRAARKLPWTDRRIGRLSARNSR